MLTERCWSREASLVEAGYSALLCADPNWLQDPWLVRYWPGGGSRTVGCKESMDGRMQRHAGHAGIWRLKVFDLMWHLENHGCVCCIAFRVSIMLIEPWGWYWTAREPYVCPLNGLFANSKTLERVENHSHTCKAFIHNFCKEWFPDQTGCTRCTSEVSFAEWLCHLAFFSQCRSSRLMFPGHSRSPSFRMWVKHGKATP